MKIEVTFTRRVPFVEMHRVDPPAEMLGFENWALRRKVDEAREAGRYRMALEAIRAADPNPRQRNEMIAVALQESAPWRS